MTRGAAARSGLVLLLLAGASAALFVPDAGCGAAKHAKIAGPPPEYEPPEPFDAAPMPTAESRADAAASRSDGAPP
jgi:hypothetical protein